MRRIKTGKYRYRGHIIYSDGRHRWLCCPDPSDMRVSHRTLRDSKKYIDEWERAFEEGRAYGNIIGASEEVINELGNRMSEAFRSAVNINGLLENLKI